MRHLLTLLLTLTALPGALAADSIRAAEYAEPTTRYAHGVLGDTVEWGALELRTAGAKITLRLPATRVFEDLAPRLVDVDGDGDNEVIVVETDLAQGAQLAIYDTTGKIASTPFIGRANRWLAPVGATDLDGDGTIEIAYVDRPHLAKILRIWRFSDGQLTEVVAHKGVTNHQIGWDFIAGGIRDCGLGPEIVLATHNWRDVVALRLLAGEIIQDSLGAFSSLADLEVALACR